MNHSESQKTSRYSSPSSYVIALKILESIILKRLHEGRLPSHLFRDSEEAEQFATHIVRRSPMRKNTVTTLLNAALC